MAKFSALLAWVVSSWVPVLSTLGTVGGVVCSHFAFERHARPISVDWWLAEVGSAVLIVAPAWYREVKGSRARVKQALVLNNALDPLVSRLAGCASATTKADCAAALAGLRQQAVDTLAGMLGADQVRANIFAAVEGPPRLLVAREWFGRSDEPTTQFTEGTKSGDGALAIADRGLGQRWPDLSRAWPNGWMEHGQPYRTIIAVPVRAEKSVFGIVTVDAPNPHSLTDNDLVVARTVATIVATAQAIYNRR